MSQRAWLKSSKYPNNSLLCSFFVKCAPPNNPIVHFLGCLFSASKRPPFCVFMFKLTPFPIYLHQFIPKKQVKNQQPSSFDYFRKVWCLIKWSLYLSLIHHCFVATHIWILGLIVNLQFWNGSIYYWDMFYSKGWKNVLSNCWYQE